MSERFPHCNCRSAWSVDGESNPSPSHDDDCPQCWEEMVDYARKEAERRAAERIAEWLRRVSRNLKHKANAMQTVLAHDNRTRAHELNIMADAIDRGEWKAEDTNA